MGRAKNGILFARVLSSLRRSAPYGRIASHHVGWSSLPFLFVALLREQTLSSTFHLHFLPHDIEGEKDRLHRRHNRESQSIRDTLFEQPFDVAALFGTLDNGTD